MWRSDRPAPCPLHDGPPGAKPRPASPGLLLCGTNWLALSARSRHPAWRGKPWFSLNRRPALPTSARDWKTALLIVAIGRFGQAARMRGRADGTLLDHLAWREILLANSFSNKDEGIDFKSHFCCQDGNRALQQEARSQPNLLFEISCRGFESHPLRQSVLVYKGCNLALGLRPGGRCCPSPQAWLRLSPMHSQGALRLFADGSGVAPRSHPAGILAVVHCIPIAWPCDVAIR
jgi:hypothetical protein